MNILQWLSSNLGYLVGIGTGIATLGGLIIGVWHKIVKPFDSLQNKQNSIDSKLDELDNRMGKLESKNKEIDKTNNLLLHSNYAILTVLKTQTSDNEKASQVVDDALKEFVDYQIDKG